MHLYIFWISDIIQKKKTIIYMSVIVYVVKDLKFIRNGILYK